MRFPERYVETVFAEYYRVKHDCVCCWWTFLDLLKTTWNSLVRWWAPATKGLSPSVFSNFLVVERAPVTDVSSGSCNGFYTRYLTRGDDQPGSRDALGRFLWSIVLVRFQSKGLSALPGFEASIFSGPCMLVRFCIGWEERSIISDKIWFSVGGKPQRRTDAGSPLFQMWVPNFLAVLTEVSYGSELRGLVDRHDKGSSDSCKKAYL